MKPPKKYQLYHLLMNLLSIQLQVVKMCQHPLAHPEGLIAHLSLVQQMKSPKKY